MQLSKDGKVIRVHPIRHDRAKELGAFANPNGRPRRTASRMKGSTCQVGAGAKVSGRCRDLTTRMCWPMSRREIWGFGSSADVLKDPGALERAYLRGVPA